jgi:hypothetical protein
VECVVPCANASPARLGIRLATSLRSRAPHHAYSVAPT